MNLLADSYKKCRHVSGQAAVEFAIILPAMLGLGFVITQASLAITDSQKVSSLSRETANAIYRNCDGESDPRSCMETVVNDVNTGANTIYKNFGGDKPRGKIIATLYQQDSHGNLTVYAVDNHDNMTKTTEDNNGNKTTDNFNTGGTAGRLTIDSVNDNLISKGQKYVVTAEVYYLPEELFFSSLGSIFLPQDIYEATIY